MKTHISREAIKMIANIKNKKVVFKTSEKCCPDSPACDSEIASYHCSLVNLGEETCVSIWSADIPDNPNNKKVTCKECIEYIKMAE